MMSLLMEFRMQEMESLASSRNSPSTSTEGPSCSDNSQEGPSTSADRERPVDDAVEEAEEDDEDDEPTSVIDQAAREMERNPESRKYMLARVFGAPSSRILPCKSCSPTPFPKRDDGSPQPTYLGWTAEDFERMTDTCPIHYVEKMMRHRAVAEADKVVQMAKFQKERKAEEKYVKKHAKAQQKKKAKMDYDEYEDTDGIVGKVDVVPDTYEADMYDPDMYDEPRRKIPKKTIWLCPECNKSAKYGSVGCTTCGEWYHTKCAGFKNFKSAPKKWVCHACE